jgi:hypothetical protein
MFFKFLGLSPSFPAESFLSSSFLLPPPILMSSFPLSASWSMHLHVHGRENSTSTSSRMTSMTHVVRVHSVHTSQESCTVANTVLSSTWYNRTESIYNYFSVLAIVAFLKNIVWIKITLTEERVSRKKRSMMGGVHLRTKATQRGIDTQNTASVKDLQNSHKLGLAQPCFPPHQRYPSCSDCPCAHVICAAVADLKAIEMPAMIAYRC